MSLWIRSQKIESWLTTMGVEWEYCEMISMKELVPDWCKKNPGRDGEAIQDVAMVYAEAQAAGVPFDAPITLRTPIGYMPLDGIQRLWATEVNDGSHFASYVVKTKDKKVAELIASTANTLNGKSTSQDFKVARAIYLVEELGLTDSEAARRMGVTLKALQDERKRREVINLLDSRSVEVPPKTNGLLVKLHALLGMPDVLQKVFEVAMGAKLRSDEQSEIVGSAVGANSKTEAVKRVIAFESRPEIQKRIAKSSGFQLDDNENLFRSVRAFNTVLKKCYRTVELHGRQVQELDELHKEIGGHMRAIVSRCRSKTS